MEFLSEYGMFLANAATLVVAILVTVVWYRSAGYARRRSTGSRATGYPSSRRLDITHLNDDYADTATALRPVTLPKSA